MADHGTRLRALWLPGCVALPVAVAVLLNALLRPRLAEHLGGIRRHHYINYRSFDGWWVFDEPTRLAHPTLTSFLELSDGAVAAAGIALAVASGILFLLVSRTRSRTQR
ncbi:hypothetical protein [Leucobacter tenebrionis]|uniref:hypothetical protein n=1 Tax=Leucobacter tenebrionis TaxID=2873270 RepID=UPI001CA6AB50|nr:hypothetical protein [Leucobacter tenebrionis]QZY52612.1 hypothetical protein KVY00_03905 [Leucobacter tenebrionis]